MSSRFRSYLGKPDLPSDPAPSEVFQSKGLETAITVVLQGFILDDDSPAKKPASITNAIVLRIE